MDWLRIKGKFISRSCSENNRSATRLGNSVTASLQDSKRALVAHTDQTSQRQFQHNAALERDKVPDVFQDKVARTVVITVAEVTGNERILELAVFPLVEPVHAAETLARGSSAQEVDFSTTRKFLAVATRRGTGNGQSEEFIAVVREYNARGVVEAKRLSGCFVFFDGPSENLVGVMIAITTEVAGVRV